MAWKVMTKDGNNRVTSYYPGDLGSFKDGVLTCVYSDGIEKIYANDPNIRSIEHIPDIKPGYLFRTLTECGFYV